MTNPTSPQTKIKEFREKIQEVLDNCGTHSLSEDTIIFIKDELCMSFSQLLSQATQEARDVFISKKDWIRATTNIKGMFWCPMDKQQGLLDVWPDGVLIKVKPTKPKTIVDFIV